MHGGIVKRVLSVLDAQEAGALLESLRAEFRHLAQLRAGSETADRCTIVHDVRGQCRADARDITQKIRAGGVEIHTDIVHADYHSVVQLLPQQVLIHIVLVLPHAQ